MTSFKSRRFAQQTNKTIHHLIAFSVGEDWYACSVFSVLKVILLQGIYGRPQGNYLGLTQYQDQEIIVINIEYSLGLNNQVNPDAYAYLLILQLANDLAGIPLKSPPVIHRVPEDNLVDIPKHYLTQSQLNCIGSKIVKMSNNLPIFLLEIDKLIVDFKQ